MKRGPKPESQQTKELRGTAQPCRFNGANMGVADPSALPEKPDWLTTAGEVIWADDINRVATNRMATANDSSMFATYCNLQGAIMQCWQSDEVPPAAHLVEARRLAEMFGLCGVKSRNVAGGGTGGRERSNPFKRNGLKGGNS